MALAQKPKVLLLDEPLAGLSQEERRPGARATGTVPRDVTIVMIEHDMDSALAFAERVTLLHYGEVIVEGIATRSSPIHARGRCTLASEALRIRDVDAYYGDSHVLHGVAFALHPGRVLGLLGRNGAGKTTCMASIMGLLPPRCGIMLFGEESPDWRPRRSPARASAWCRRAGGYSLRFPCGRI